MSKFLTMPEAIHFLSCGESIDVFSSNGDFLDTIHYLQSSCMVVDSLGLNKWNLLDPNNKFSIQDRGQIHDFI